MMIRQVLRLVPVSGVSGVSRRLAAGGAVFIAVGLAALAPAAAEPPAPALATLPTIDGVPGRRVVIEVPRDRGARPLATISTTLYLERCRGGCTIRQGSNDARSNMSTIPMQSVSTISEFRNREQRDGTEADDEWNQVVQCMKEVYSPFNVAVTDVKPTSGLGYHQAIIAGAPADIDFNNDVLGVAPLASDCSAIDNVISFSFANVHPQADSVANRVLNICWTAAQESAHAFGLDHEYSFSNNRSACNDPMTYRNDCGGQKFFRNDAASCGEVTTRPCRCGASQNSHLKLLSVFGPGTPITGSPTVVLSNPSMTSGILDRVVTSAAGSKRGVARVEVLFNGYKWLEVPGAPFGRSGQNNPSDYSAVVPAGLPNSIVDVKAIAYDDLGAATESAVRTVTRGAACESAATCAAGQRCEAGKCFWDPPVGELGDSCTFLQFCKSGICTGTSDQQICTQNCVPGVVDTCPMGYDCIMQTTTTGVCFFADSGGCCSVDRSDRGWLAHLGLAALVLGFVMRRRRR